MACNADARVHHFYFNSCDDANDFIDRIDTILDNYGRITLQDMDALAGIAGYIFEHGRIAWNRDDLMGTGWNKPIFDGDYYIVSIPRNIAVKKTGIKSDKPNNVNAKSPNPIAVAINASCLTEEDFARIYREVMNVATEIKDRDILIQIV